MKKLSLFLFLFFFLETIFGFNSFANSKDLTDGSSGTAEGSFTFYDRIPGNAFDNDLITYWFSAPNDGSSVKDRSWIGFTFTEKKVVTGLSILQSKYYDDAVTSVMVQGSDDKRIWYDVELISLNLTESVQYITLSNIKSYKSWRLLAKNGKYDWMVYEIELFGPDLIPPAMPKGLTVVAGHEKAILNWDSNSEEDINGYNIYLDGNKVNSSPVQGNYYEITNLSSGREYKVSISAVDTSGNESPRTAEVSVVPLPPPDTIPPGEVSNITVSPSDNDAYVTFTGPEDRDVDHYEIYLDGNLIEGNLRSENYTITGLLPQTEYTVIIKAVDVAGNKSNGVSKTFTTLEAYTPPPIPSQPTVTATTTQDSITLTWRRVDYARIYKIYDADSNPIGETDKLNYTINGLEPGRVYTYKVTAVNETGESLFASVTAKTNQQAVEVHPGDVGFTPADIIISTISLIGSLGSIILLSLVFYFLPKIIKIIKDSVG